MYSPDDPNDLADFFPPAHVFGDHGTLAYVRPVTTEKGQGYGVYAADGTQLAVFGTRDAAFYAAMQHELNPMLVH